MDRATLARCCYALSDETRLRVIELLSGCEKCVCDLQAAVGVAQSLLSFHLKVLRDAGLVNARKQGRWVHYSIRGEVLEELGAYVLERAAASTDSSCDSGEGRGAGCDA